MNPENPYKAVVFLKSENAVKILSALSAEYIEGLQVYFVTKTDEDWIEEFEL